MKCTINTQLINNAHLLNVNYNIFGYYGQLYYNHLSCLALNPLSALNKIHRFTSHVTTVPCYYILLMGF